MSYVQNFTITAQTKAIVLATDTSVGVDINIASRAIFFQKYNGTYLVPTGTTTDFVAWPLSDGSTKTIDLLDKDYSLNVTVQWLDSFSAVLYEKTILYCFPNYAKAFLYTLTQYAASTANPLSILNNKNYITSKSAFYTEIVSAENAVGFGGDITSSQSALDRAKYYIDNPQLFH